MSQLGHSRLSEPVMPTSRCPLPSKSDLIVSRTRNDAMGRKRKFANSFDHLVGAGEKGGRHGDTKRFGCLQIDRQLKFRRLHDRQIGRLFAAENTPGVSPSLAIGIR
jgi:hypothetical protein